MDGSVSRSRRHRSRILRQRRASGFQFIQDPLDYDTVTHHSDADTYAHAIREDMMQASAVITTFVYDIAKEPELVPRTKQIRNGKLVR
jgi:hypothetical protein